MINIKIIIFPTYETTLLGKIIFRLDIVITMHGKSYRNLYNAISLIAVINEKYGKVSRQNHGIFV